MYIKKSLGCFLFVFIVSCFVLLLQTTNSVNNVKASEEIQLAWSGELDLSWGMVSDEDGIYRIYTPAQLAQFADIVNNGTDFSGKVIRLCSNIDLGGENETPCEWTPIGNYDNINKIMKAFCGTFDGGNYLVSNIYINNTNYLYGSGLFGAIQTGGIVKNINVEGVISGAKSTYLGGIVGYISESCIDNCSSDITIKAIGSHCGGIVGEAYHSVVKNCVNYGNIVINNGIDVGGIAGCIKATTKLSVIFNCCNYGYI